jgi:solute carrier family 25 oxoglutarate transporter 11
MLKTGYNVIQHEGALGLYRGLGASLMRQASFIGTKFGAYDLLKTAMPKDPDGSLPFWKMTLCGLGAGAIGAAVGNPADLAMVRMQADGRLPKELRRNYRGGGDALSRVVREEGVLALWRGCGPTVNRAMIVTASQMAVYDKSKSVILRESGLSDGLAVQTGASFFAGIVAALTSNPIDLAKSRLMSMKPDPNTGALPYSGTLDCIAKTVRHEGIGAVYKGLIPTTARQVPLNMVRFISVEWCKKALAGFD